jgi:hypothetical protein
MESLLMLSSHRSRGLPTALHPWPLSYLTLNMEAEHFSKTSVNGYQTNSLTSDKTVYLIVTGHEYVKFYIIVYVILQTITEIYQYPCICYQY